MLGIVIANWNGAKIIGECLESLNKQTFKTFKVYIVDNGSNDESISIINNYKERLNICLKVLEYNSGFAKASNIGISEALKDGCDYILTLNNDIEVKENCLETAMKEIENNSGEYDVYQLFMINYYNRDICDAAGLAFDKRLYVRQLGTNNKIEDVLNDVNEIDGVCAGASIYSSESLKKVVLDKENYFDSNFFAYYEDVDLALRLRNFGFKSKLLKESIVYHMHSVTGDRNTGFKDYYCARNLQIYVKRNQTMEKYKANKFYYNRTLINMVVKSLKKPENIKHIIKGIKDGNKEAKVIRNIFE